MDIIKRYWAQIAASFGIASLYFFLRLVDLSRLPIFTDEAIYIRWAQIALQDPNWRFISLSDGKQPLFIWCTMMLLRFFQDPLLAGRAVSVMAGFLTAVGLWFVSYELFKNRRIAYLASLTYVCFPFAQVADRMALYDSLSGTFTVWALYFSILLVRRVRLDLAYTAGIAIGFGVLNKSTNFFSLYLLPFTLLLFNFSKKDKWRRLIRLIVLLMVVVAVSEFMYAFLRLSGLFYMIKLKNALFIFPLSEWIKHPFQTFPGNITGLTNWLFEYLKIPYTVLIVASFIDRKFLKEKLLMLILMILPFFALALFGRIIFPRFLFFMTLSLLPLIAYGLNYFIEVTLRLTKKYTKNIFTLHLVSLIVILAFLFYPVFVSYQFAKDPVNSRISNADRGQYSNNWTAGWGVRETISYLKSASSDQKIFVGTEGTFGLMPFALEIYLKDDKNITTKGYWPLVGSLPDEVLNMAKNKPTFFIFYQPNNINPPNPENLRLIFRKQMGSSQYYYRLYQVVP